MIDKKIALKLAKKAVKAVAVFMVEKGAEVVVEGLKDDGKGKKRKRKKKKEKKK